MRVASIVIDEGQRKDDYQIPDWEFPFCPMPDPSDWKKLNTWDFREKSQLVAPSSTSVNWFAKTREHKIADAATNHGVAYSKDVENTMNESWCPSAAKDCKSNVENISVSYVISHSRTVNIDASIGWRPSEQGLVEYQGVRVNLSSKRTSLKFPHQ